MLFRSTSHSPPFLSPRSSFPSAETAITVDDVAFVVDTGRMKENRFDPAKRMASLDDCLVILVEEFMMRMRMIIYTAS